MQYSRFLVSLYKENNPLPQMYASFDKRSEALLFKLNQSDFQSGICIIYNVNTFYWCEVKDKSDKFKLDVILNKDSEFIIMFFSDEKYIGKNGKIEITNNLINRFVRIYENICLKKRLLEEGEYDDNYVLDNITKKIFGKIYDDYYEKLKVGLSKLFVLGKREEWLEKEFNDSIFVSLDKNDEKIMLGIIYRNKKPYGIAMGGLKSDNLFVDNETEFSCKIIEKDQKLWEFIVRRASDGDIL